MKTRDVPPIVNVTSSKGGVGKSTTTIGLAGEAAHRGMRTLVIDIDNQMNATTLLLGDTPTDGGRGLYRCVMDGDALEPIPSLHNSKIMVVPAGDRTESLYGELARTTQLGPEQLAQTYHALRTALHNAVRDFDFVVIDTPPTRQQPSLRGFLFSVSTHTVFPALLDDFSTDAVRNALLEIAQLEERGGPSADPTGILLTRVGKQSTRMQSKAMSKLDDVASIVPFFSTPIHHLEQATNGCISTNRTPREFAELARQSERQRLKALGGGAAPDEAWSPKTAGELVDEYALVFSELLERIELEPAA